LKNKMILFILEYVVSMRNSINLMVKVINVDGPSDRMVMFILKMEIGNGITLNLQ